MLLCGKSQHNIVNNYPPIKNKLKKKKKNIYLPVLGMWVLSLVKELKQFFLSYLCLMALGLHCCASFSLVVESRGYSLVAVCGLRTVGASLIGEHGL